MPRPKPVLIDNHDGTYKVLSSDEKKYYTVSPTKCECAGFQFRQKCRHIDIVLKMLGKKQKELKFDKEEYAYLEFIEKFGGESYDRWLAEGVIMRKGDRVRVV